MLLAALALCGACAGGAGDPGAPGRRLNEDSLPAQSPGAGSGGAMSGGTAGTHSNIPNAAGMSSTDSGGPLHGCNDLQLNFAPVIPIVLLVIDRSGSMFENAYATSPTRWQALYDGLIDPDNGVLKPLENEVSFGVLTYTGNGTVQCPVLNSVDPALGNYEAIKAVLDADSVKPDYKAETPTGAALRTALGTLQGLANDPDNPPGPRFILLITDGEPDSCTTPDPQCGQDESIKGLQDAYGAMIGTFVVGISGDVGAAHLQDLANAGAGMPVRAPDQTFMNNCINPGYATMSASYAAAGAAAGTAPIYQPQDRDALTATIRTIIRGVTGCSFTLDAAVDAGEESTGTVLLDGMRLEYGDPNGWHMLDARTIELTGTACTTLRESASELKVSFPCESIMVL